jgi:hypothetical protein
MSLDKLLAAAITYFETGTELHRTKISLITNHQKAIAEHESAIVATTKKVAAKAKDTPAVADVIATVKAEGTPKVEAPDPVPEPAAIQLRVPDAVEPESEPAPSETAVNYETDIRPLIRSKSLSNRDGVVKLLYSFHVKSGQELTTAQHSAFLNGLQAL